MSFPGRGILLKWSLAVVSTIWLASAAVVVFNRSAADATTGYAVATRIVPLVTGMIQKPVPSPPQDGESLMNDFAEANEASLVALRGFVLTGGDGFRSEWQRNLDQLEAAQAAMAKDSRSWTDGARLLQLSQLQKTAAVLIAQEEMVAGLVATPNRFPGLRLYNEDIDPVLGDATRLCDRALQSIMASNWAGTTPGIDALAGLRGSIRQLRDGLAIYLPSAGKDMPADLQTAYRAVRNSNATLAALRGKVSPADQAQLDRLALQLRSVGGKLDQVLALKQTQRWDYADYAFRQKVLPLAEKISGTLGSWRSAS